MIGGREIEAALNMDSLQHRRLAKVVRFYLAAARTPPTKLDSTTRIIVTLALLSKTEEIHRSPYETQYHRREAKRLIGLEDEEMVVEAAYQGWRDEAFSNKIFSGLVPERGQDPDLEKIRARLTAIAQTKGKAGRKKNNNREMLLDFLLLIYEAKFMKPRWSPLSRQRPIETWFKKWSEVLGIREVSPSEMRSAIARHKLER